MVGITDGTVAFNKAMEWLKFSEKKIKSFKQVRDALKIDGGRFDAIRRGSVSANQYEINAFLQLYPEASHFFQKGAADKVQEDAGALYAGGSVLKELLKAKNETLSAKDKLLELKDEETERLQAEIEELKAKIAKLLEGEGKGDI